MFKLVNTRFRLKMGWINPFKLKPQFCLLNDKVDQGWVSLVQKQNISEDTYLMRFDLNNPQLCLGTQIGQHIGLSDPQFQSPVQKCYVPISRIDDAGYFDLLVKEVVSKELSFSSHLTQCEIGHKFLIKGPNTTFLYDGFGQFQIRKDGVLRVLKKRYVGLISEGTALASFFQLIEGVATNGDDTQLSLFHVVDRPCDMYLLEELMWLVEEKKLQAQFLVRKQDSVYPGLKGEISSFYLADYLPPPSDESLIMICGSKKFKGQVKEILTHLSYEDEMCLYL